MGQVCRFRFSVRVMYTIIILLFFHSPNSVLGLPYDFGKTKGFDSDSLPSSHHTNTENHFLDRSIIKARAWTPPEKWPGFAFPEEPLLSDRENVGICFSGGGYRSYIATIAYLRGLKELDLLKHVRYIAGTSGSSWAVSIFSYYARAASGFAEDDLELLGDLVQPENITLEYLRRPISKKSARFAATQSLSQELIHQLEGNWTNPWAWGYGWRTAIGHIFLEPYGIPSDSYFTWDDSSLSDIFTRNPSFALREPPFLRVNSGNPFPIIGFTMLGPVDMEPFIREGRKFLQLEATPLYIGSAVGLNVSYEHLASWCRMHRKTNCSAAAEQVAVGGLLEPFAFGGADPPAAGIAGIPTPIIHRPQRSLKHSFPHHYTKHAAAAADMSDTAEPAVILDVPAPTRRFTVADAAGASSYAPAAYLASSVPPPLAALGRTIGTQYPYWAPAAAAPRAVPAAMGDGGDMESPHLIGLLVRGVTRVVVFGNFDVPLRPAPTGGGGGGKGGGGGYDPRARPPRVEDVDDDITPFFGVVIDDWGERHAYDFSRDQVFNSTDFPGVISAMQAAQAGGRGIVVTTPLVTIENRWWGLRAGLHVQVTWVYLSRALAWESSLPPAVRDAALPTGSGRLDPTAATGARGPFRGFPYFSTNKVAYDPAAVTLLSQLCAWVTVANADVFRAALAPPGG